MFHISHITVVRVPEQRVCGFESELGHLSFIFCIFSTVLKALTNVRRWIKQYNK